MLGITWRDNKMAQYVREKAGVRDIIETLKKLKVAMGWLCGKNVR